VWHVGVCRLWDYGRRVVEYDKLLVPELLEDGWDFYLFNGYLLVIFMLDQVLYCGVLVVVTTAGSVSCRLIGRNW